jgi:hypothetical protein
MYHPEIFCTVNYLSFQAAEDDLGIVYQAVFSLAGRWHTLCVLLGIPKSTIKTIEQNYPSQVDVCLSEGLSEWLQCNYNTDKYGLPSWRMLLERVGIIKCALARGLAKKHEGNLMLRYSV